MTIAVRLPAEVGAVVKVTVSWVAVAAVTVPAAPRLKATVLLAAVGLNPVPAIVRVEPVINRFAVDKSTVGRALGVTAFDAADAARDTGAALHMEEFTF